jgi:photosystem II stability/assembly factor-like uncharacterized protein
MEIIINHKKYSTEGDYNMSLNIYKIIFTINLLIFFSFNSPISAQWIKAENSINSGIATLWNNGTILFAGTSTGVYISSNGGVNWKQSNSGLLDGVSVYCYEQKGINIFAGTSDGLFRSSDEGNSWKDVSGTISIRLIQAFLVNGQQIYAGTRDGGLWLSTDEGSNWKEYDYGLNNPAIESLCKIGTILIAGTEWSGAFISRDNGSSWDNSSLGMPPKSVVHSLFVYGSTVFAGILNRGIYRSKDNGSTWSLLTNGLPMSVHASSFLSSGNYLFAATPAGVFVSADNGDNWKNANIGIPPNTGVSSLAIVSNNMFAAVDIGAVYKRPLSELLTDVKNDVTVLKEFLLKQNYPNPFNPSTKINFELPKSTFVLLRVFDLLGREIATLMNKEFSAGHHEVSFDGSNLPSGIYVYRIQAGEYTSVKKMILMK